VDVPLLGELGDGLSFEVQGDELNDLVWVKASLMLFGGVSGLNFNGLGVFSNRP